jgi:hypothetical protein
MNRLLWTAGILTAVLAFVSFLLLLQAGIRLGEVTGGR